MTTVFQSDAFQNDAFQIDAAGGTINYSLVGDTGTFSYSGSSATLNRGRSLSATGGTYSYTGSNATLKRGYSLTGAVGTYSYSGSAATLKRGYSLSATGGIYSLVGGNANLVYTPGSGAVNYTLSGDGGIYAYSGGNALLKVGKTLPATGGVYSYSGGAATLSRGYSLVATGGSYSYSGSAATLTYAPGSGAHNYTLTADGGVYSYAGCDALLYTTAQTLNAAFNVYGLRAQIKRHESEEQKRIRREAQGIINRINKVNPKEPDEYLLADAENIAEQINEVIAKIEANAKELAGIRATKAQEKALRALLIDAQIEHEYMIQQQTDLDVAFVAVMLAELY